MSIATVRLGRVKRRSSSRDAWCACAAAILALLCAGCPGDLPTGDVVVKETQAGQEGGLSFQDTAPSDGTRDRRSDAQPTLDRRRDGITGKSCKEVLDCGMQCPSGADVACITACLASACASGSQLAQSMYLCGVKVCAADCAVAFSPTCLLCLVLHCPTEYNACLAHTSCGP